MPRHSNFIVRGGLDFSNVSKGLNRMQTQFSDFQSRLNRSMSLITKTLGTLAIGKLVKDGLADAMQVEAALMVVNRQMGKSAQVFTEWAESQARAFNMSRAEATRYGATYSNLITVFTKSGAEAAEYTQKMIEAGAITASATGRTIEDTMERIRSGMLGNTEAIEDLGISIFTNMLVGTEAFKKFANGKSWKQLNFQTQQQIRYHAILEQVYEKFGTEVYDNTISRQMRFIASLKDIRLNLGQAFMPIYNIVLPALTALTSKLEIITKRMAMLSEALFGKPLKMSTKNIQNQTNAIEGLNEATQAVGKAAKGALAPFDELNVLQQNKTDGGEVAAAMGAGVIPEIEEEGGTTDGLVAGIEKAANKIKTAFASIKNAVQENKDYIISALAGIGTAFAAFKIISNWGTLVTAVKGAFAGLATALGAISLPALAVAAVIGVVIAAVIYLWRTNEEFRDKVLAIWEKVKAGLSYAITTLVTVMTELWNSHVSGVVATLWGFLGKLMELIAVIFNKVILPLISYLVDKLGPMWKKTFDGIVAVVKLAVPIISDLIKAVLKILGGVIDFMIDVFTGDWEKAWNGIVNILKGVWNGMVTIVESGVNLIIDAINGLISKVNSLSSKLNIIPGVNVPIIPNIKPVNLPRLASGGIATRATAALIGEAGQEAVLPLENNTGWMDELAERLSTEITINFKGELAALARILNPAITKERKRKGDSLVLGNI